MLSKNVLSKVSNAGSMLAISAVLLGSAFILPSWAMEDDMQGIALQHHTPQGGINKGVRSKEDITKMWERPASPTYYYNSLQIELPSREVDETPISFAQMSQIHPQLEKVSIKTTSMGTNVHGRLRIQELAQNLKTNTTVKELILSKCAVDDEGAQHLATMIQMNTTLSSLFLDFNNIGDVGAAALGASLNVNTTLKSLSLISNKQMSDQGITALGTALYSQPHNTPFVLDLACIPSQKTADQRSSFVTNLRQKNVIIKFQ